ncbi:MAG: hypothetical protein ACKOXB_02475 [Flavobacteriales bacterium]
MKTLFYLSFATLLLTLGACKKLDKFTQFNMDYTTSVVIPASNTIGLPLDLTSSDMTTNSESTFQNNDTRKDKIEEVRLTKMTATVSSPTGADMSFLKSVELFVKADGLEEKKVAWHDNVPDNVGTTLNLYVTDDDLKDYIKKEKISIRIKATTDKETYQDYTIDIYSLFRVNAKILGI